MEVKGEDPRRERYCKCSEQGFGDIWAERAIRNT